MNVKIRHVRSNFIFALLLLAPLSLSAQTRKLTMKDLPPTAFKLASIKATGSAHYTWDQIVAATGLEVGQTAADPEFKKAAQELGESGVFSDVLYTFQSSAQGTKVEFEVTDSDKLLPVRFDNFVWFTDEELQSKLRARVPLFQGLLPLSGDLPNQVSDALQVLLIEKNIPAQADYLRAAGTDGSIEAYVYSVTGPTIRVRSIAFTGAKPDQLPELELAAKKLVGSTYLRSMLRVQEDKISCPCSCNRAT